MQCHRDARGEHGIEELGGITQKRKVAPHQRRDIGRVVRDRAERDTIVPDGIPENARQPGNLGNHAPKQRFIEGTFIRGLQAGSTLVDPFRLSDEADGGTAVTERNQPAPDTALGRVGADQDLVAVKVVAHDAVIDVREDGLARRQHGRPFQPQQSGQHTAITAGIQHEAGLQGVCPFGRLDPEAGKVLS